MNRILKISLISAGSVAATALVSSISYIKGKRDGFELAVKKFEGQLEAAPDKKASRQPQA